MAIILSQGLVEALRDVLCGERCAKEVGISVTGEVKERPSGKFMCSLFDTGVHGFLFDKPYDDLEDCLRRMDEEAIICRVELSLRSSGHQRFQYSGNCLRDGKVRGGLFRTGEHPGALIYMSHGLGNGLIWMHGGGHIFKGDPVHIDITFG